jgi:hypothetical protein
MWSLLDTPDERHALVIGFSEVLCPWPPRIEELPDLVERINEEYHYYLAGRGLGFIALVALVSLVLKYLL